MSTVIYLENNPVLRKNLFAKDEIIKNLVETQSTALNTISAKSNIQHLNSLNQANFSLPSKNLNQHSHNTKQLVSQEQQHPPIPLPRTLQLKEILHPIQTHHQRLERNITTKSKYLSNLLEDIAKQNICEFFGLNSACYSPDTCNKRFPYK